MLAGAHGGLALEGEPFLQTGTAEGVQTVEEGQWLVEHVCAYLVRRLLEGLCLVGRGVR